jgi:hypothetical protein
MTLIDTFSGTTSAEWGNRVLLHQSGNVSVDWNFGTLFNPETGTPKISWGSDYGNRIFDGIGLESINYGNRQLKKSDGTVAFDWENDVIGGGAFIPITGTTTGDEVSGSVAFKDTNNDVTLIFNAGDGDEASRIVFLGNANTPSALAYLTYQTWASSDGVYQSEFRNLPSGLEIQSSDPASRGIIGGQDYTANITELDYVQKKYVDDTIGGGAFLPLAGGTMGTGANISWVNGSYIAQGSVDQEVFAGGGIGLVCSVGYELNWQAGQITSYNVGNPTPVPIKVGSDLALNSGQTIRDFSLIESINPNNRKLFYADSSESLDWQLGRIYYNGVNVINWRGNRMRDSDDFFSLDWGSRELRDFSGNVSTYWGNRLLVDTFDRISVSWENRTLTNASALNTIDWNYGSLYSPETGLPKISWGNDNGNRMWDEVGNTSIDYGGRFLMDASSVA